MNQNIQQQQNQQNQVQKTPDNPFTVESLRHDNAIVYTYKLAKHMTVKKPVIAFSWSLGLILLFFVGGLMIPQEKQQVFNQKMDDLNKELTILDRKAAKMQMAYQKYYDSKGYFWTCDDLCTRNYNKYLLEKQNYDQEKQKYDNQENQVREYVGIWSEYSVDETKNMFWNINKEGTESAKNMSKFDIFFRSIGMLFDRDREIADVVFQLIFDFIWNILITNIITFVRFSWNIIWQVLNYSPNPVEGGIFLVLSLLAAGSWFFAYNYVLFLIGRGTVNIALDMSNAQRLENGNRQQRQRQYIHQQQQQYRPHYD